MPCGALHMQSPVGPFRPRAEIMQRRTRAPYADTGWLICTSGDPSGVRAGLVGSRQGHSHRSTAPIGVAAPRAMRSRCRCQEGATKGGAPLGGPAEVSQPPEPAVETAIATQSPRCGLGVVRSPCMLRAALE